MNLNKLSVPKSSFLSCEKDAETIIQKLFVSSGNHSESLKRLLVVNTKDCLDNPNGKYTNEMKEYSVKKLMEEKYISLVPRIKLKEHEELKSYIVISFDDFVPTSNPQYRDCEIHFDILCHIDYWELANYQLRPFKIMGIIDTILEGSKLSGIGTLRFIRSTELLISDELAGYSITYLATHGNDDMIEGE